MKNLVKIKDTFFCSVRHCGKAMLLLVALTALSSSAWAAKVLVGNTDCGIYLGDKDYYTIPIKNNNEWDGTVYVPYFSDKVNLKISQNYTNYRLNYWFQDGATGSTSILAADDTDNGYIVNLSPAPASGWVAITVHLYAEYGGDSKVDYLSRSAVAVISPSLGSVKDAGGNVVTSGRTNQTYTLSASATGGTSSYKYEFYVDGESLGSASTTATKSWKPTTAGTYKLKVKVTDGNISDYNVSTTETEFVVIESSTPTVLISKSEKVEGQEVTLSGYLKYTGCKNINNVGFIISKNRSEVEAGTAQVYNATTAPDAPIAAMSDFSLLSDEFENETYYYRAWMKASDETVTISEETRSFTPAGVCNITDAASVLPIFESGKTTESATFTEGSASINLKVDKNCIADVYQWNVKSQPDDSHVGFVPDWQKRNVSITVDKVGTYTFTLSANCSGSAQVESSRVLTLYVCEPAETTQLYLDNHTDNVLCAGEKATATCITKEGYTYSLYSPSGGELGSLAGTGGTQTWRNVTGAGEFTMRTSPTSMPQCAAVVSSATQRYNEPTMEITADPGLSVLSYQPVILSKKDVESPTYVDTDPTWVITDGSDKAYLLNEHNRLAYDNRARESVVFKAGAGVATQITVQASAYKTVEVDDPDDTVGTYTKQCPATKDVTLTVSPAVDDCD